MCAYITMKHNREPPLSPSLRPDKIGKFSNLEMSGSCLAVSYLIGLECVCIHYNETPWAIHIYMYIVCLIVSCRVVSCVQHPLHGENGLVAQ